MALLQQVRYGFLLCTNSICLPSPIIFLYVAGLKNQLRLTEKKSLMLYKAKTGIILVNTLILLEFYQYCMQDLLLLCFFVVFGLPMIFFDTAYYII